MDAIVENATFTGFDRLTPKAIVAALDRHIVGQVEAKKAVAVALRNRWRRQQLSPELRDEVTPKNILMIGPTGCGKTEISRRLAKLADAPFLKIEATKFTEVGYVGRDVDSIIRDLVEESIRLTRDGKRASVREAAEKAALDRLRRQNGETEMVGILTGMVKLARMDLEGARAQFAAVADTFPASDTARAIPKSMTLMREGRPRDSSSSSRSRTMTLAGLMSRWITPCSWL